MVSRRRLSARAVSLGCEVVNSDDLAGVVLRPAGHRPLSMPRNAPDWWDSAVGQLTVLGDRAGAALQHLFVAPVRCYELAASPGERKVALLASFDDGEIVRLVVGILTVDLNPRKQAADWGHLEVTTVALRDDDARQELFNLAEQLTAESLRARDPDGPPLTAIVVGDLASSTRAFLTRRLWAYGVRVDAFLEQPYRNKAHEARERIRLYEGDLLVLLQAGCGNALGVLLSEIRGVGHVVLLAESDLEILELELDEALVAAKVDEIDPSGDGADVQVSAPSEGALTVTEAANRIRVLPDEEGRFVLTENCLRGLEDGLLADPSALAEQSESLRDLALRWSRSVRTGGLGGDIVAIARADHGLVLARTDEPMRRAKLDKFDYDGGRHSRETHVKVTDHTSANRVARIYFAFDAEHEPPRVIVDHIGPKISPYVKR